MKPSKILMAIGLCLIALGLSGSSPIATAAAVEPPAASTILYLPMQCMEGCSSEYAANRLRAIELANIERVEVGCPAALINDNLMRATQAWSEYMDRTRDFRHAPHTHYAPYGYPQGVLENIGTSGTPDQLIEGILLSPRHRINMLYCEYSIPNNSDYNPNVYYEIGIGESNGYWVMGIIPIQPTP